jgi:hypothetical protein
MYSTDRRSEFLSIFSLHVSVLAPYGNYAYQTNVLKKASRRRLFLMTPLPGDQARGSGKQMQGLGGHEQGLGSEPPSPVGQRRARGPSGWGTSFDLDCEEEYEYSYEGEGEEDEGGYTVGKQSQEEKVRAPRPAADGRRVVVRLRKVHP